MTELFRPSGGRAPPIDRRHLDGISGLNDRTPSPDNSGEGVLFSRKAGSSFGPLLVLSCGS